MLNVSDGRAHVLAALDAAQRLWLQVLQALGLTDLVDGQAAWPHEHRFAAQVLAYDDGLLTQLIWCGVAVGLALLCVVWAAFRAWRALRVSRAGKAPCVMCVAAAPAMASCSLRGVQQGEPKGSTAQSADRSHTEWCGTAFFGASCSAPAPSTAPMTAPVVPQPAWLKPLWPLALAGCLLWLAPWPAANLLLLPAVPSSFHASPTGFSAHSLVQGQALYQQHCASCHGETGRADGPRAGEGEVWPPMLAGGLLGKRLEGELLWRVRHGWDDAARQPHAAPASVAEIAPWLNAAQSFKPSHAASAANRLEPKLASQPAAKASPSAAHRFAHVLSVDQTWQVLDFLAANVAGQTLAEAGEWPQPVKLPRVAWHCDRHGADTVAASTVQASAAASATGLPAMRLRVVLVGVQPQAMGPSDGDAVAGLGPAAPAFTQPEANSKPVVTAKDDWMAVSLPVSGKISEKEAVLPNFLTNLQPDPRMVTLLAVPPESELLTHPAVDCEHRSAVFQQAMAIVLGVTPAQLPGHQLLVDSAGWLRARSTPASPGWHADDLVCKPAGPAEPTQASSTTATGLDALIARMDAAPLSPVRAGFAHR